MNWMKILGYAVVVFLALFALSEVGLIPDLTDQQVSENVSNEIVDDPPVVYNKLEQIKHEFVISNLYYRDENNNWSQLGRKSIRGLRGYNRGFYSVKATISNNHGITWDIKIRCRFEQSRGDGVVYPSEAAPKLMPFSKGEKDYKFGRKVNWTGDTKIVFYLEDKEGNTEDVATYTTYITA